LAEFVATTALVFVSLNNTSADSEGNSFYGLSAGLVNLPSFFSRFVFLISKIIFLMLSCETCLWYASHSIWFWRNLVPELSW
jgi:hypothetical protein